MQNNNHITTKALHASIPSRYLAIYVNHTQANHTWKGGVKDEFMEAWISSRVLPLVSGTSRSTNTTVRPQMLAKMKNVPAFRSKPHINISSEVAPES